MMVVKKRLQMHQRHHWYQEHQLNGATTAVLVVKNRRPQQQHQQQKQQNWKQQRQQLAHHQVLELVPISQTPIKTVMSRCLPLIVTLPGDSVPVGRKRRCPTLNARRRNSRLPLRIRW